MIPAGYHGMHTSLPAMLFAVTNKLKRHKNVQEMKH